MKIEGVRARRLLLFRIAVCALVVLAFDQALQFTLLREGYLFSRRIAAFDPPIFADSQQVTLARIRARVLDGAPLSSPFDFDPDLGWCSRSDGGEGEFQFDWSGSRIGNAPIARVKDDKQKRIVAMGDSFTLAIEVGAKESWSVVPPGVLTPYPRVST